MPILHSVGDACTNLRDDVVVVQVLLSLNRPSPLPPLVVDGIVGPRTLDAIGEFQGRMALPDPPGRVEPVGATMGALRRGVRLAGLVRGGLPPGPVGEMVLRGIMPGAATEGIARFLPHLVAGMAARAIHPGLRQAHFLAQLAHESVALRQVEAPGSGEAHEGRMELGNAQPGDGARFRGRGLFPLTGRAAYAAFGRAAQRDLLADPEAVAREAALAVEAACWFWETKGINALADADDLEAVTRRVSGGLAGFADRQAHLRRALFFLLP